MVEDEVGDQVILERVEGVEQCRCPDGWWNWFAVILADQFAQGSNTNLKVGNEFGIKVQQAHKGVQGLSSGGGWPVADRIIL